MKLPCIHVSIVCIRGFRSKEVLHGGSYAKYLKLLYFPSDSFLFDSLDQNSPTFVTRHSKVIVSLNAVILKNVTLIHQTQRKKESVYLWHSRSWITYWLVRANNPSFINNSPLIGEAAISQSAHYTIQGREKKNYTIQIASPESSSQGDRVLPCTHIPVQYGSYLSRNTWLPQLKKIHYTNVLSQTITESKCLYFSQWIWNDW